MFEPTNPLHKAREEDNIIKYCHINFVTLLLRLETHKQCCRFHTIVV